VPLTNGMGALVVTRRFFARLPYDLKALLRETGYHTGKKLIAMTRIDNARSIDQLKQRGLQFIDPDDGMSDNELLALRNRAAESLIHSNYIPSSVFEETRKLLEQYRNAQATANTPTP